MEGAIWFILMGLVISGAFFFLLNSADWTALAAEQAAQGTAPSATSPGTVETVDYREVEDAWNQYGAMLSLAIGFIYSGFTLVYAFFFSLIVWIVGTTMLGGTGILFDFLLQLMRANIVVLVASVLAVGFG
ncbi:MAG: hypothetical protein HC915_12670, partial [Anaerolineae bacterium]|nr:hypothetical protein [Anaerolineae bacterium]